MDIPQYVSRKRNPSQYIVSKGNNACGCSLIYKQAHFAPFCIFETDL